MKARELKLKVRWSIGLGPGDSLMDGYDQVGGSVTMDDPDKIYHVREVLPGQITITREEYHEALRRARSSKDYNGMNLGYLEERELFGPRKGE
jgi:hypothetical protein